MAEHRDGGSGREGARYYRHDEAFWREMLAQWQDSGLSIRGFCRQQGLAVSTFGLWRKRVEREQPAVAPLTVTADTAFIAAGTSEAPSAMPVSDTALPKLRDQVVVALAGALHRADRHACRAHRALRARAVGRRTVLITGDVRAFICRDTVDMRKSIDGLSYLVQPLLGQSPLSGHLFVFVSRDRSKVKILYWDRTGFALWYKRLERRRFPSPAALAQRGFSLAELNAWLEGIEIPALRPHRRVQATRVM